MTTTYHTAITTGAAANAAVVNAPLAQIDAAVGTLYNTVLLGGAAVTQANGAASAGQKVVTVDSSSVFKAGCYVEYALAGGALERNSVDTVDSTTQITLTANIGTGGIPDNGIISVVPKGFYDASKGIYNVLDYGATGDGVAEDASAIQAALTACAAAGGGIVHLPAGTYLVNTELQIKDDTELRGAGIGATVITTGATLANAVLNVWQSGSGASSGADNVTLRDFTLEANGTARIGATLGGYVRGIRTLYGPENLLIQRVKVNDGGSRAIEVNQGINVRITDCIVTNASVVAGDEGDGIHCEGTNEAINISRNIVIDGCTVEICGDTAIATTACREVIIANNTIRGAAAFGGSPAADESGIDMTGVRTGVCSNNKMYMIALKYVNATANTAGAGFASSNIAITGNTFIGDAATQTDYGISVGSVGAVADCGGYTIANNVITNTYYPAIGIDGAISGASIVGNTIINAMLEGDGGAASDTAILIGVNVGLNASKVLCAGNTIIDTGSHIDTGIYINAANTENVAYGNLVSGSSVTLDVKWVGADRVSYYNSMYVMHGMLVNPQLVDEDSRFSGTSDSNLIYVDAGNNAVGMGISTPAAKLYVYQTSATGAKPVLTLKQGDVSEEFIKLIGTSTTDASQSLVDAANLATPGAIVGWFKVYVQDDQGTGPITDGVYYVPFYAAPTA